MSHTGTKSTPSTWEFVRFLAGSYPRQTVRTSLLITLSSAAEALGVATMVPALNTAIRTADAPDASEPLGRILMALFAHAGIPYSLVTLMMVIALFMTLKGTFQWLAWRAGGRAMADIATDLRLRLAGNLFRARWPFFVRQPLGTLATAVGHETYATAHAYLAMCQLFSAVLLVLVYLAAIALVSPAAVPLTLVVGLMLVAPLRGVVGYTRRIADTEARAQQNFVTNLLNAIQSIKPVRAMGSEASFETIARSDAGELRASIARQVSVSCLMPAIQEPILVLGISLFLLAGSYVLEQNLAGLAVIVFALWRCGAHVSFANRAYRELVVAEPYYRMLRSLLDASREAREDDTGAREVPTGPLAIRLDDIGFAHGSERILDGLFMELPAGSITAIVGESGIGKSTLIDLLLAFHRPAEGRILVNGVPLSEISVRAWRAKIGYVPQETTLFHGSVFDNVSMGDPAVSEADIRTSLVAAGAWDFVDGLERGVRTVIGERGARLSGGQRQRIAIARALARKPALLLLDEFTASLDPQTEMTVIATIQALRPHVTVVIATHQAALVGIADVVYRIDNKRAMKLEASAAAAAEPRH